jgi:hypothetical protein
VPFVRVSRDKRGYEHIYLIDSTARRGKAARPRVLYWFRTPPGVMVGREPFDESVRRTLEAQYPDVTFDWEKLCKTAIPAPDVEPWRERRRVERAAKQARQGGEREETDAMPPDTAQGSSRLDVASMRAVGRPAEELEAEGPVNSLDIELTAGTALGIRSAEPPEPVEPLEPLELLEPLLVDDMDTPSVGLGEVAAESVLIQTSPSGTPPQAEQHRRRRRRGGRRRRQSSGSGGTSSSPSNSRKEDEPTG